MLHSALLQCKFFLVAWVNISSQLLPNPFRKWYYALYGLKIGKATYIHRGCRFFHVGKFSIGDNSVINFGCILDNRRGIFIGNNVGIAHHTKIYTLGHNPDDPEFKAKGDSVHIENNVFIFSNALIMPGVTIGEGAVVLAGSVVTKDVAPWMIVGGNPAKPLRERKHEIHYSQNYPYWFAL